MPVVAAGLLFATYGWALIFATASRHDGAIGPSLNALGTDWAIFMTAGHAAFTNNLAHIYEQQWITSAVNTEYSSWLSAPEPFPIFPYPPVYLLFVAPFSLMPMAWSLVLSQLLQFGALGAALLRWSRSPLLVIAALLAPAASNNVSAGSNAVLVVALVVGGLAALETRPMLGGILLGLVCFKPQFVPLLIVALVAGRYWRSLAAMVATAVFLVVASIVAFGAELWLDWLNVYLHPQTVDGVNATEWGHLWDDSVSTCLSLLGAPRVVANTGQAVAALLAAAAVWWAYANRNQARIAILLCGALLASPHIGSYDLIGLAIAALFLVARLHADKHPVALLLPVVAYAAPFLNPPRATPLGLITPLLIAGVMWKLFRNPPNDDAASLPGNDRYLPGREGRGWRPRPDA